MVSGEGPEREGWKAQKVRGGQGEVPEREGRNAPKSVEAMGNAGERVGVLQQEKTIHLKQKGVTKKEETNEATKITTGYVTMTRSRV